MKSWGIRGGQKTRSRLCKKPRPIADKRREFQRPRACVQSFVPATRRNGKNGKPFSHIGYHVRRMSKTTSSVMIIHE